GRRLLPGRGVAVRWIPGYGASGERQPRVLHAPVESRGETWPADPCGPANRAVGFGERGPPPAHRGGKRRPAQIVQNQMKSLRYNMDDERARAVAQARPGDRRA